MNQANQRATQPLNRRPANPPEDKPQRPPATSPWFIAPFLWFNWACAWIAYALSNVALLKVLEYAGKATVLVAVVIWLFQAPEREEADRRTAWSVVNSKGGGRREALEHLYHKNVDLRGLYGEDGFFEGIDLHGADIKWAHLAKSDFYGSNLRDTKLVFANLGGANLYGADLTGATLMLADLTGANLMLAHLAGANLMFAHLAGANLYAANLNGVNLTAADITGAELGRAKLYGAKLNHTNLNGANLSKAIGLIQAQIDAAYGDERTRLPPGIHMPERWKTSAKTTQPKKE
jgi:Pentapeptide repeats (8 copies)